MFVTAILFLSGAWALTTVGYDCGSAALSEVRSTTYSLLDVHACSIKKPIIETKVITGQIVQTKIYEFREVFQCRIKIKRNIRRCSFFGYLEPVENGMAEFLLDLNRDQCKSMHLTRSFAYDTQHVLTDLKLNQTSIRSISLAGNAIDNSCNVGTYSDRFGTWNNVNVESVITITLISYIAKVDIIHDKILLRSGLACKYTETECNDIENGFAFWEHFQYEDCLERKIELIYQGEIEAVTEIRDNVSSIHYFVSQNENLATLKNNGMHDICHMPLIKTDFPNLYIIENKDHFIRIKVATPDLITYLNAKFVHVQGKTKEQMSNLYLNILNKKCESDLSILRESLSMAFLSPDSFAYDLMGPGFIAHLSGELIHIIKCASVEVEIRKELETCYNQLPVLYNGKEMFLKHKTKILVKHGTERKCNKLLPIAFKVGDIWISFTPKLTIIPPPKMLSPGIQDVWEPKEIKNLATGGLYTLEEIQDYTRQVSFPIERTAILENTAAVISGIQEEEKNDEQKFSIIEYGFWRSLALKYWKNFQDFGIISAGLIMTYIILYVIIQIINIVIRGLTLHRVFGFSSKILAAILGSLTHFVLVVGETENRNKNEKTREDIELGSIQATPNYHKSFIPVKIQEPQTHPKYDVIVPSHKNNTKKSSRKLRIPIPAPRKSLPQTSLVHTGYINKIEKAPSENIHPNDNPAQITVVAQVENVEND